MIDKPIKIIPLGGCGEIGKNCTVIEHDGNILVIDAGLKFPEDDMYGVDLVIPDYSYLVEHRDQVRAIVLTHGHEDHIGGLTYLLREIEAPVYATPLTRGLVETKLRGEANRTVLHTMTPGEKVTLPGFEITPFHVNHSIPDAVGLAVRTPLGLIVHTGDFKIDETPLEGKTTDLSPLQGLLDKDVLLLLLADSTNAESPGKTASERQLLGTFESAFEAARGRIIVATFASLLSRVQLVIETAAKFGRKVAIAGRSMEETIAIGEQLGYVRFPAKMRVPLSQIDSLADADVCVVATGSQGEPNAALARMAAGRFRYVSIKEGDTVLVSSKPIPGNEKQVNRNIDNLFRRGANVIYGDRAGLHVSGHGAQEDLKTMLGVLQPLYFVPVHGEYRMLQAHARLAEELGYRPADVFVLDNGHALELDSRGARRGETIPIQTVLVDGSLVGDVGETILRDRQELAREGVVFARVSFQLASGQVESVPQITSRGFVYAPESQDLWRTAESAIVETVTHSLSDAVETAEIEKRVKRRLEDLFYMETRRRPLVYAVVHAS
jgi:ribonuclease J